MATGVINVPGKTLNGLLHSPRLDEGIRVELMTIPPDLAAKWLKRNRINRPLQRRHIASLVAAIRAGQWDDCNGETIIFSKDNNLLDGQHRLTAVVECQHQIVSLVVFGVDDQKRASIDTGARRKLADYLGMQGEQNVLGLASTLQMLHAYERRMLLGRQRGMGFTSYDEGLEFLGSHPGIQASVTAASRIGKLLRRSCAGMVHYLFTQKDAVLSEQWAGTLQDGRIRPPYEVFLTLRERLIRDLGKRERLHDLEQIVYCIKAWNAAREGKHLQVFKWQTDEGLPEIR